MSVLTKITLSLFPRGSRFPESTQRPGVKAARKVWQEQPCPASQGHGCRRSRYCGSGLSLMYF